MKRQDDTSSMSVSAWARSRGLSVSAAFRAIRDGRITRRLDGRLDPERADAQWRERTRFKCDSPFRGAAPKRTREDRALADLRRRYLKARTELESANVRLREHELARLNGTYLLASEVERTAFECARRARDRLVTIPDRVASLLTGVTDRAEIHKVLGDEVRLVCDELSGPPMEKTG